MTLIDLIRGRLIPVIATAIAAIPATDDGVDAPTIAKVAGVAVANPGGPEPVLAPPEPAALVDFEPGWQEREAIAAWHRDWSHIWTKWQRHITKHSDWQPSSPFEIRCGIAELVATWSRCTGQHRDPAEVLGCLADEDYGDRELMHPGALALFVWTCLAPTPGAGTTPLHQEQRQHDHQ